MIRRLSRLFPTTAVNVPALPPSLVDLPALALATAPLQGAVPLCDLPRLLTAIHPTTALATLDAQWKLDDRRRPWLTGVLLASVSLTCQRCLEPVDYALKLPISLVLVRTDREAAHLSASRDPWLWDGETFAVWTWVEEEILLALPLVPTHDFDCQVKGYVAAPKPPDVPKANPFAVLANLKRKDRP